MGFRLTLSTWLLAGIALDGVTLASLWLLLYAVGPLPHMSEAWLDAIAFVSIPWLVHVIVLPVISSSKWISWYQSGKLLLRTLLFIAISAMMIPFLGTAAGAIAIIPLCGLLTPAPQIEDRPGPLSDNIFIYSLILIAMVSVAAGIGILLHFLRDGTKDGIDSRFHEPRLRSDVLGAALAAFLACTGMFGASALGIFLRPVDVPGYLPGDFLRVPLLPATLMIGIIAFLPHLLMIGTDMLRVGPPQMRESLARQKPA